MNNPNATVIQLDDYRITPDSVLNKLADKSAILDMQSLHTMISRIRTEQQINSLIDSIIHNSAISDARKSMFFQSVHLLKHEGDFDLMSPEISLALYYGLLSTDHPNTQIVCAHIIRKVFGSNTDRQLFKKEIFPILGQHPFNLAGNTRTQISTKILTAAVERDARARHS